MSKKTDAPEPVTVETEPTTYSLPELGIAVEAASVDEAVEKGKAHAKKLKEKK